MSLGFLNSASFQFPIQLGQFFIQCGFQGVKMHCIKPEKGELNLSFLSPKSCKHKTNGFSRTQVIISRNRATVLKEICVGKVCKLTSALHATLNFITLVTSHGRQRGVEALFTGSSNDLLYSPGPACLSWVPVFRLHICKLRKKLRGSLDLYIFNDRGQTSKG